MRVLLDGLIFQMQARGGISRLFIEVLPRMCALDPTLKVDVLLASAPRSALPQHPGIRTAARWPRLSRKVATWLAPGLWHSTYYTLPEGRRRPVVISVYDLIFEKFPHLYSSPRDAKILARKRQSIEAADALICISESARQDVLRFYKVRPDHVFVAPLAHSPIFRPLSASETESALADLPGLPTMPFLLPFLLYIGPRHIPYKFFDGLLRAYARWPRRDEIALVAVGAPPSAEERAAAETHGLHIIYLSGVEDAALCALYNRAAAFVYPSLDEGFGIPLLEAMACGCPVVASSIPSSREVAGDVPFYFEPGPDDVAAERLCAALDAAIQHGHDADRVARGLARLGAFSWDRTAALMLDVYRRFA